MLISTAHAFDGSKVGTGSSGGGIALLIILGSGILLYTLYRLWNKWYGRDEAPDNSGQ